MRTKNIPDYFIEVYKSRSAPEGAKNAKMLPISFLPEQLGDTIRYGLKTLFVWKIYLKDTQKI